MKIKKISTTKKTLLRTKSISKKIQKVSKNQQFKNVKQQKQPKSLVKPVKTQQKLVKKQNNQSKQVQKQNLVNIDQPKFYTEQERLERHPKTQQISRRIKFLQSESEHLRVIKLEQSINEAQPDLFTINNQNLFQALIYPLDKDQFFNQIFSKKALVIKGQSSKRFKEIVKTQMFNLDLRSMCENTASDKIHIWFPKKHVETKQNLKSKQSEKQVDNTIKSIETEDPDLAVVSYLRGNASLYFGSSLEFRNLYCKSLSYQMGMNFGAYFPDYQTMGEIETFCSRKGNLTDYHIDFQENFTLQIKGSKIWRFRRSELEQPLLGYTPHYQNTGNIEEQAKVHLAYHSIDINQQYQKLRQEDIYEIRLEEGDILYHPAGIWHQVECDSDESISINFSLRQLRYADLITNATKMLLLQNTQTRLGIRYDNTNDLHQTFQDSLSLLSQYLTPSFILPECIHIPRILEFDMDKSIEENGKQGSLKEVEGKDVICLNPLFVLNKVSDFPQIPEDLEDAQYVVNGLFGNEDHSSQVRIILLAQKQDTLKVCDYITTLYTDTNQRKLQINHKKTWTVEQFIHSVPGQVKFTHGIMQKCIRNLIFNGILVYSKHHTKKAK
eukprot:403350287